MTPFHVVIGVDLSLTGLGLVALPQYWNHPTTGACNWALVKHRTLETDHSRPLIDRMGSLAADVATWVRWILQLYPGAILHVVHEGYPIGGRVYNLDKLAELGGVVKHALRQNPLNLLTDAAPQSAARKLMIGKLPQRGRKAAVIEMVRAILPKAGAGWTDDECDALVAANWLAYERGLRFLTVAPSTGGRAA
jgi:Holliday junction resolvasome RuvABC endonuclease subunit